MRQERIENLNKILGEARMVRAVAEGMLSHPHILSREVEALRDAARDAIEEYEGRLREEKANNPLIADSL